MMQLTQAFQTMKFQKKEIITFAQRQYVFILYKKKLSSSYLEQCKYKEKRESWQILLMLNQVQIQMIQMTFILNNSNMYFRLTKIMLTLLGLCFNLSALESSIKHNIFYVLKCGAYTSLK